MNCLIYNIIILYPRGINAQQSFDISLALSFYCFHCYQLFCRCSIWSIVINCYQLFCRCSIWSIVINCYQLFCCCSIVSIVSSYCYRAPISPDSLDFPETREKAIRGKDTGTCQTPIVSSNQLVSDNPNAASLETDRH